MKPVPKRLISVTLLLIVPVTLFFVIRERQSWRPRVLGQMKYGVTALAWSPDGKALASAGGTYEGQGGDILLWGLKTSTKRCLQSEPGAGSHRLWFLQNNKLFCRTDVNTLLVYDARSGVALSRPQSLNVNAERAWTISPDGRQIVSREENFHSMTPGYFALRDLSSRKAIKFNSSDTRSMAINKMVCSPDGKRFAAFSYHSPHNHGPALWLWDVQTPQTPRIFQFPTDVEANAELTFWPDAASVIATDSGGFVVVDRASVRLKKRWRRGIDTSFWALSPDGRTVACGDYKEISIYYYPSMHLTRQIKSNALPSNFQTNFQIADFSPDGCTLAVGDYQGRISLWRIK